MNLLFQNVASWPYDYHRSNLISCGGFASFFGGGEFLKFVFRTADGLQTNWMMGGQLKPESDQPWSLVVLNPGCLGQSTGKLKHMDAQLHPWKLNQSLWIISLFSFDYIWSFSYIKTNILWAHKQCDPLEISEEATEEMWNFIGLLNDSPNTHLCSSHGSHVCRIHPQL